MIGHPRGLLTRMFQAAVQAAQAEHRIADFMPQWTGGRTVVVGAGKASAAMACAFETHWSAKYPTAPIEGLVVTPYGYSVHCDHIQIIEGAHPVPDRNGEAAAQRILQRVRGLKETDLLVCLISGGGSSLLALPGRGVTLTDQQTLGHDLLTCGATIAEVNCVRRHLSGIKGGRLAAASNRARLINLLISDVPGDRLFDIASGPTVADPTTCANALEIVHRYAVNLPKAARQLLESGAGETIKPGDSRLERVETHLIATPQLALEAAATTAANAGLTPMLLGDRIEGESREVGKVLGGIALQVRTHGQPARPPCVLLSGGETTVTVRGSGCGGRNVECLLSTAIALDGADDIYALMADTDGVDGQAEVAGALITPNTLERAWAAGMSPRKYLDNNDAHHFFQRLGDSLVTGPTLTNVNDFRAIMIL